MEGHFHSRVAWLPLGRCSQTRAFSAVSRRELSGDLTCGAHRQRADFSDKVQTPPSACILCGSGVKMLKPPQKTDSQRGAIRVRRLLGAAATRGDASLASPQPRFSAEANCSRGPTSRATCSEGVDGASTGRRCFAPPRCLSPFRDINLPLRNRAKFRARNRACAKSREISRAKSREISRGANWTLH